MAIKEDRVGHQTFTREDERSFGVGNSDRLPDSIKPGHTLTNQVLYASNFEELKVAVQESLEQLRVKSFTGIAEVAGALSGRGRGASDTDERGRPGKSRSRFTRISESLDKEGRVVRAGKTGRDLTKAVVAPSEFSGEGSLVTVEGDTGRDVRSETTTIGDVNNAVITTSVFGAADQVLTAQGANRTAVTIAKVGADLMTTSANFGAANQVLLAQGTNRVAATTSTTIGTLVKNTGTPADNQVAIFTAADTVEGDSNLTWDASNFAVTGGMTVSSGITLSGGFLTVPADSELTIATGAITATKTWHNVDTEADAATDDLDTINGGSEGRLLILRSNNNARDVTVKDGTGNISCAGDFTLSTNEDSMMLIYSAGHSAWVELSRSDNS